MAVDERLTGARAQALTWVAYRDGNRPERRYLNWLAEVGYAAPPKAGHDPHWRLTELGGRMLRANGLARDASNMQSRSLPPRSRPTVG